MPVSFPSGIASSPDAPHHTFGAEFPKRARDRRAADGWQSALKISVSKLVGQATDDIPNHIPLRAALGARRTDAILEFSIRLHQYHPDEVLPPGNKRVLAFVPVLRRSPQRVVVALFGVLDRDLEASRLPCAPAAAASSGPRERRRDSGSRGRRSSRRFAR